MHSILLCSVAPPLTLRRNMELIFLQLKVEPPAQDWRAWNCSSAAAVSLSAHAQYDHVTHKDCKSAYSRWDSTKRVSGKYLRNYSKAAALPGVQGEHLSIQSQLVQLLQRNLPFLVKIRDLPVPSYARIEQNGDQPIIIKLHIYFLSKQTRNFCKFIAKWYNLFGAILTNIQSAALREMSRSVEKDVLSFILFHCFHRSQNSAVRPRLIKTWWGSDLVTNHFDINQIV